MKKTGICVICSTPFEYTRGSKKTCSQKCRKQKSRLQDEAKKTTTKPIATTPNRVPTHQKELEQMLWKLALLQAHRINNAYCSFSMHQDELFNLVQQSETLLKFIQKHLPSFYRSKLVVQVLNVPINIKGLQLQTDQNGWLSMQKVPGHIFKPCFQIMEIQNTKQV